MLFWLITGMMCAAVALALLGAAARGASGEADPARTLAEAELAELEADITRGTLAPGEAEAVRAEIKRRLIRRAPADRAYLPGQSALAGGIIALVPITLALGTYFVLGSPEMPDEGIGKRLQDSLTLYENRPSQAERQPQLDETADDAGKASFSDLSLIARLREVVANRPDDREGHDLLATQEAAIGNYQRAWTFKARANELSGGDASDQDYAEQAGWMVEAAGGYVTPEAELVLQKALEKNPQNEWARYYLGLLYLQIGRPDIAFRAWNSLYQRAEQNTPLIAAIAGDLPTVALLAGARFTPRPELDAPEAQPDIGAMIAGLDQRLRVSGGTPDEWAMLIRSRMVSGDVVEAAQALERAMKAYPDDVEAQTLFQKTFDDAGVVAPE